ncbi:hypothetical protein N7492_001010 [Penicillium capsulatum]|uniref:BTB domain-containing protein n=1 Tax=Penicillium capsulatum TaxID=69766 RepID=A0A9W9ISW5_9EURO|nr:hypothetical protein N7492_001010 [Penicillium capsulatum]
MLSKMPPQTPSDHFTRYRAAKASARSHRPQNGRTRESSSSSNSRIERRRIVPHCPPDVSSPTPASSPIVMLRVGPEKRLFAAHEAVLCTSPFFAAQCRDIPSPTTRVHPHIPYPGKRIDLPDEIPEVLSCVLEYLYKGDYYPRLRHNAQRRAWELEDTAVDATSQSPGATVRHHRAGLILRDTVIYCAAGKYTLPSLQRLALRKQGLHTGIDVTTILSSARFAYAHTPDTESKLRAHYLALIIRSRGTFKRSGTMQMEMERGGRLFFDLFVAMCNHMDDVYPPGLSVCSSTAK